MTTPPEPAAPSGEPERIASIAELRAEQQRQAGVLDEIKALLAGRGDPPGQPVTRGDPPPADVPDIGEQMRAAIRAVNAERDAKTTPPPPEKPPREVGGIRGKARLQRGLFGAP